MSENKEANKPLKRFSTGVINATVWENQGQNKEGAPVVYKTVSMQRRYQDKDGKWQSTNSLRINDLPRAVVVMQKAYEYLVLKDESSKDSEIIEEEII